jgi:hypothetical protein
VLLVEMDGVGVVVEGYLWIVTAFNKIWKLQFTVNIFLALVLCTLFYIQE